MCSKITSEIANCKKIEICRTQVHTEFTIIKIVGKNLQP